MLEAKLFALSFLPEEHERSSAFQNPIKMEIRLSLKLQTVGNFFWLPIKAFFINNKFHSFIRYRGPIFHKLPCESHIKPVASSGSGFYHSYDYLAIRKGHNNFTIAHTL